MKKQLFTIILFTLIINNVFADTKDLNMKDSWNSNQSCIKKMVNPNLGILGRACSTLSAGRAFAPPPPTLVAHAWPHLVRAW